MLMIDLYHGGWGGLRGGAMVLRVWPSPMTVSRLRPFKVLTQHRQFAEPP